MSQDIRLTVLVPDDLRKRAKAEAALQGTSLSAIVRHALEEFWKMQKMWPLPKRRWRALNEARSEPFHAKSYGPNYAVDKWRIVYVVDDDIQLITIIRVRLKTGPETYEDLSLN